MHTKNSVSKKLLALALAVLMCISVVPLGIAFASENSVYMSSYDSLPAAIQALGSEGGTIYLDQDFFVDGGLEWESTRGPVTIQGVTGNETLELLDNDTLANCPIYGDITFKNLKFKGGRSLGTYGHTVTFDEGITVIGEPLVSLGSNSPSDKFVFKSGTFGRILPRMASDMVKDYEYVVDGATFAPAFEYGDYVTLGLFNSGSAMNGNLTFTMNSGSINGLLLGPNGNFNHYGVLKFVMNGGTVTNAYFGSTNANSYIQNMAIIFNKATMTDGVTLNRLSTTKFGTYVVVENNNEVDVNVEGIYGNTDYALTNTSFCDNLGYWVKVNYGKANPVYARTDEADP
ncbi:MAG: hypothetical protein IJP26_04630, partial [Clostridia bacterium]|nr:hypothetical protein [Clostridia bacterium]